MTFGRGRGQQPQKQTGAEKPPGQQKSSSSNNTVLDKMVASGRSRLGDPYSVGQHWYAPPGGGVSCSGLIYSMRKDAGLKNPYWGTYGYMNHYTSGRMGFKQKYIGGKGYSAGTLFISTSGAGGPDGTHMAMSVGNGQVIESVFGKGVQLHEQPGSFADTSNIAIGVMPDVGTGVTDAIKDPGGAIQDAAGELAGNIADGIAQGLLRVVKYIYGKVILQPLDFFSGFWWEFLKHLIGEYAPWERLGLGGGKDSSNDKNKEQSPDAPGWEVGQIGGGDF